MERIAYRIDEAQKALGIGRTTIYAAIGAGELKTRKVGRRTVILRVDLEDWVSRLPYGRKEPSK